MKSKLSLKIISLLFGGAIITAWVFFSQPQAWFTNSTQPDTIFINGDIVTVNPRQAFAQAVAVKDGLITAVGSQADVEILAGKHTEIIDLNGQALLPGFIEPHTHPIASAMLKDLVDLSGFSNPSPKALYEQLARSVESAEDGEWILAFGLDPILTKGLIPPDRHKLDEIAPRNPVFILSQVMHTAYVNSLALERSKLDANSPDPDGGHFERDEQGELNGIAHEAAIGSIQYREELGLIEKIKQALNARQSLIDQYQRYADAGYTTVGVPGPVPMFDGYLKLLEHVASRDSSPLRSFVYPMADEMDASGYPVGYQNGHYTVLGVKIYLDGSPWTGAMATAEPYLSNDFTNNIIKMKEGNLGILKQNPERLYQQIQKYHQQGWQIAVHSHGERAHDLALDTIAKVQAEFAVSDSRHRLEHLGLITEENLERAAKLGVTPSFFIDHIYYFGETIEAQLLGPERANRFMPTAWANKYHQHVSIHTDNPATPIDPMRALRTAVTRLPRSSDKALNTSQAMSVENALEAITIDAAWQMHADDRIGSIEPGKQADFTLLSANPHKVQPEQWATIKPVATWLAGKKMSGE